MRGILGLSNILNSYMLLLSISPSSTKSINNYAIDC